MNDVRKPKVGYCWTADITKDYSGSYDHKVEEYSSGMTLSL